MCEAQLVSDFWLCEMLAWVGDRCVATAHVLAGRFAESHGFSFAVLLSVSNPTSRRSRIICFSHKTAPRTDRNHTQITLNVP